jgi:hypothetical protein
LGCTGKTTTTLHAAVEILAPVRRDQDDTPVFALLRQLIVDCPANLAVVADAILDLEQRVDAGVAGDIDLLAWNVLAQERIGGTGGRREMQRGDRTDDPSVYLFRKRRVVVSRAQARFDMVDGNLVIEGRDRRGHGRGGVALHHDAIRAECRQCVVHSPEHPRRQLRQGLVRLHQIEINVGSDVGDLEHLIEHLPVLCRHADEHPKARVFLQRMDDRKQLDRFRSGPEGHENVHYQPLPVLLMRCCKASRCSARSTSAFPNIPANATFVLR